MRSQEAKTIQFIVFLFLSFSLSCNEKWKHEKNVWSEKITCTRTCFCCVGDENFELWMWSWDLSSTWWWSQLMGEQQSSLRRRDYFSSDILFRGRLRRKCKRCSITKREKKDTLRCDEEIKILRKFPPNTRYLFSFGIVRTPKIFQVAARSPCLLNSFTPHHHK